MQRERNSTPPVRHRPVSAPPPPTMVGSVPVAAVDVNQGLVDHGSKILPGVIDLTKLASGLQPIQVVSSLPALPSSTYPQGAVVFNTTDNKLYRSTGSAWTTGVDDVDISSLTASKITAGTLSAVVTLSGVIETGVSGIRAVMDSAGVRLYGYPAPYVRSAGPEANGTGAVGVTLPKLHKTNDILILLVETAGSDTAPSTPTGYTKKDEVSTGSTATDVRLTVFWKRDGGSETNPTLASTGFRQSAFITAVAGCTTSGDPFDVTATTSDTTSNTSGSANGVTTTLPNELVLIGAGFNPTRDLGNILFSAWANANLVAPVEVKESFVDSIGGHNGALALAQGVKVAVGATGATTFTLDSASKKAMWVGAMKSDLSATVNLDSTTGNGAFGGSLVGAKIYSPRDTGDRSVFGPVPIGNTGDTFPGMGIVTYRDADVEGESYCVAYQPVLNRDQIGAQGGSSELRLWAVGADNNDKSTLKYLNPNKVEYAALQIESGWWAQSAATGGAGRFIFNFSHWDSTNALISATPTMDMVDATGAIEFQGINQMPNLARALNLLQGNSVSVTINSGSNNGSTSVTFGQTFNGLGGGHIMLSSIVASNVGYGCMYSSKTASGFTMFIFITAGTNAGVTVTRSADYLAGQVN